MQVFFVRVTFNNDLHNNSNYCKRFYECNEELTTNTSINHTSYNQKLLKKNSYFNNQFSQTDKVKYKDKSTQVNFLKKEMIFYNFFSSLLYYIMIWFFLMIFFSITFKVFFYLINV